MLLAGVCLVIFSLSRAIFPAADGANILVFMPLPFKSHMGGFQPMFEELAGRGHNVTVVTSFPLVNRRIANYTDIAVPLKKFDDFDPIKLINQNVFVSVITRWYIGNVLSDTMENENIKEFIRSESNTFDLVIIESFYQEYNVALGHKFNAPVIFLAPAMMWVSLSKWAHIPSTFSYIPDCCIGVTDDMSFLDRLKNTIAGFIEMYVENYVYIPSIKRKMNKYFDYKGWKSRPPLEKMLNNVSLTLMNANHAIGVCRPLTPGVVEVGGMHIKDPKPLPRELQDFIDSAADGVIYFSFGSFLNLSNLPDEILKVFLNVIDRLKQRVILKWVPDSGVKLPRNLKTGSWLPQIDILAHPNVRLFISHGGFHSIEEAVFNAKPVLGIPFFADQISNMKIAEKKGYGKRVNLLELNEERFENAIKEVIYNPNYKENAIVHSLLYKDQPMKPLDRAIYWIEYVIRNGGAKHLISESAGLNDPQYFLFDVTLSVIVPIGLITWLFYRGVLKVSSTIKTN